MTTGDSGDIVLTDRASYDHWTELTMRFSDQDPMGHVNNAAYAVYFEVSRVEFFAPFVEPGAPVDTVLARITINFLRETSFPGTLDIGARLLGIGSKSVRSAYGIFRDDLCLATAECVNVFFDTRTRRSTLPPASVRTAMENELARSRSRARAGG